MHKGIHLFLIPLCFFSKIVFASYCYPDYCQRSNVTPIEPVPGIHCLLTPIQKNEASNCIHLRFENVNHISPLKDTVKVKLSAYVIHVSQQKLTAFNLSLTDVNFNSLITRYQSLADETLSACRYINLYRNETHPAPTELYVSCPFADQSFENVPYHLEYLVTGDDYEYSKKLVFTVPNHNHIDEYETNIKKFAPFIYADVSDTSILTIYIQPAPIRLNVLKYRIWLINNDTNLIIDMKTVLAYEDQHIQHNFTVHEGVHYFKVSAVHPNCGEDGCINSTTPFISIRQHSHRLLIMIISVVWIPPVILYAFYHIFKIYKRKISQIRRQRRPYCLLMYTPSHAAHVNVMATLTKYLRCCNINAMLDIFDIPESKNKDPFLWCNNAFDNAEIILIATSPSLRQNEPPTIYQNIDNHILRLLKENYSQRDKRYYIIQLPYCKASDIPEEAKHFKRLKLPEHLSKLVKTIHNIDYFGFHNVSDHDLQESIRSAILEIKENETVTPITDVNNDNFLMVAGERTKECEQGFSREASEADSSDKPEIIPDKIYQTFSTNINELNLLGENVEEGETLIRNPKTTTECEFRIDKLNL
ncbi:uncharacterized protein [Prorops nasuta]|uniref:uncharacterized protein n=1 Tax=Prorops nasuta TaxID=863751 RepID=UPI0034CF3E97